MKISVIVLFAVVAQGFLLNPYPTVPLYSTTNTLGYSTGLPYVVKKLFIFFMFWYSISTATTQTKRKANTSTQNKPLLEHPYNPGLYHPYNPGLHHAYNPGIQHPWLRLPLLWHLCLCCSSRLRSWRRYWLWYQTWSRTWLPL